MEISRILPVLKDKRLLLASNSPRRRELLGNFGAEVHIAPSRDVDESYPADMEPERVPEFISRKKAEAYFGDMASDEILVTADTVVIVGGAVLGKPHSHDEAVEMLRLLSGKTHTVATGVTLADSRRMRSFTTVTAVRFDVMTDDEIEYYVERFRPYDKAGAYGIQEWIGYIGISGINGDYYNVMGLPLHDLFTALKDFGCESRIEFGDCSPE